MQSLVLFLSLLLKETPHHTVVPAVRVFRYMRTVTPQKAGVISIADLEDAVCQPVTVLQEKDKVIEYLVC